MSRKFTFKDLSEKEKDKKVENLYKFTLWFKKEFNLDIYLQYGTLLGAVRENNLIDIDNDIDTCYLSKYSDIKDVYSEMLSIYDECEKMGVLHYRGGEKYFKNCGYGNLYLKGTQDRFDLWTSWIDDSNTYYFWAAGRGLSQDFLLPLSTVTLRGYEFLAPNKSKEVLEYLYTKDWTCCMNKKAYYYSQKELDPINKLIKQK
jgi:hypothetical protein